MENAKNYNESALKQGEFCEERRVPLFVPKDGVCFRCRKNIFEDSNTRNKADKEHITGCPFCGQTYCD